jgi:sirohydrochlorin ferrochelatase
LNKASLTIDRGSREPSTPVFRVKAGYHHTNYCFFEVFSSINDGIRKCRENANLIIVIPYLVFFSDIRLKAVSAVWFCSLGPGKSDIQLGIKNTLGYPKVVILMSYFLHRGAHFFNIITGDVNDSLKKYPFEDTNMRRNLAYHHKLIDLLIDHAKDAED